MTVLNTTGKSRWAIRVTSVTIVLLLAVQATVTARLPGRPLFRRDGEHPLAAGVGEDNYQWSISVDANDTDYVTLQYSASASREFRPGDFQALFYWLDAEEFLGRRIKLWTVLSRIWYQDESDWGGLFMRLDATDGTVLAFDNMSRRPFGQGSLRGQLPIRRPTYAAVVLDVSNVPKSAYDTCPDPARVPRRIAAGMLVSGRARMAVSFALVQAVDAFDMRADVTDHGFWHNPCHNDLGEGYEKPQAQ